MKTLREFDGTTPRRAILVHRQHIAVGDVSRTGCRLRGEQPLMVGATGMLTVHIDGKPHVEIFRVARTSALPGMHAPFYEAGVEFLPVPADTASLQDLAAQLDRDDTR